MSYNNPYVIDSGEQGTIDPQLLMTPPMDQYEYAQYEYAQYEYAQDYAATQPMVAMQHQPQQVFNPTNAPTGLTRSPF